MIAPEERPDPTTLTTADTIRLKRECGLPMTPDEASVVLKVEQAKQATARQRARERAEAARAARWARSSCNQHTEAQP